VIGDAKADRYLSALEAIKKDKNTDMLLVLLTPQAMTEASLTAQYMVDTFSGGDKPVVASFMGGNSVEEGINVLDKNRIPNFTSPERAINALEVASKYSIWKNNPKEIITEKFTVDNAKISKLLAKAETQNERTLGGSDAMEILTEYGFVVPKIELAETGQEAVELANKFGYPVVMKIASPDILHKSDIGGVRLGVNSPAEVERAFEEIISSARRFMSSALILGVTINQMIPKGKEVILGMAKDPDFGPMLMFGLGGIYVEVLKDVAFRIAPIDRREANSMITEIRSFPLLRGVRGEEPADIPSIADSLVKLSHLVTDFPEIIEMDINPLMVMPSGKGAVAVDCRISVEL
jgi:acyl-CoA synthetase (NDP forming)